MLRRRGWRPEERVGVGKMFPGSTVTSIPFALSFSPPQQGRESVSRGERDPPGSPGGGTRRWSPHPFLKTPFLTGRNQQLGPAPSANSGPSSFTPAARGSPLPKGGNGRVELGFVLRTALKKKCLFLEKPFSVLFSVIFPSSFANASLGKVSFQVKQKPEDLCYGQVFASPKLKKKIVVSVRFTLL